MALDTLQTHLTLSFRLSSLMPLGWKGLASWTEWLHDHFHHLTYFDHFVSSSHESELHMLSRFRSMPRVCRSCHAAAMARKHPSRRGSPELACIARWIKDDQGVPVLRLGLKAASTFHLRLVVHPRMKSLEYLSQTFIKSERKQKRNLGKFSLLKHFKPADCWTWSGGNSDHSFELRKRLYQPGSSTQWRINITQPPTTHWQCSAQIF